MATPYLPPHGALSLPLATLSPRAPLTLDAVPPGDGSVPASLPGRRLPGMAMAIAAATAALSSCVLSGSAAQLGVGSQDSFDELLASTAQSSYDALFFPSEG